MSPWLWRTEDTGNLSHLFHLSYIDDQDRWSNQSCLLVISIGVYCRTDKRSQSRAEKSGRVIWTSWTVESNCLNMTWVCEIKQMRMKISRNCPKWQSQFDATKYGTHWQEFNSAAPKYWNVLGLLFFWAIPILYQLLCQGSFPFKCFAHLLSNLAKKCRLIHSFMHSPYVDYVIFFSEINIWSCQFSSCCHWNIAEEDEAARWCN